MATSNASPLPGSLGCCESCTSYYWRFLLDPKFTEEDRNLVEDVCARSLLDEILVHTALLLNKFRRTEGLHQVCGGQHASDAIRGHDDQMVNGVLHHLGRTLLHRLVHLD